MAQPFCRQVNDYSALVGAISDRCDEMALARLELDRVAGLATGHSGKLLSQRPVKYLGLASLGAVLQSLGLILLVVEDPVARDRTLARRTPVDAAQRRVGNHCNPKKSADSGATVPAQIESAPSAKVEAIKPRSTEQISRSHLRVIEPRHKGGARWGGGL